MGRGRRLVHLPPPPPPASPYVQHPVTSTRIDSVDHPVSRSPCLYSFSPSFSDIYSPGQNVTRNNIDYSELLNRCCKSFPICINLTTDLRVGLDDVLCKLMLFSNTPIHALPSNRHLHRLHSPPSPISPCRRVIPPLYRTDPADVRPPRSYFCPISSCPREGPRATTHFD